MSLGNSSASPELNRQVVCGVSPAKKRFLTSQYRVVAPPDRKAMPPFSSLTSRKKLIEMLRWVCVLPAAVLGEIVVRYAIGLCVRTAGDGGWRPFGDSTPASFLWTLLCYAPPESAFVIAGAMLAPRRPMTTAIVLAVLRFILSLMTHVVGQHLAGNHVGITNYLHLFAESAGLLTGAAYIAWQSAKNRRPNDPSPSGRG
jgi:hypothetical protein